MKTLSFFFSKVITVVAHFTGMSAFAFVLLMPGIPDPVSPLPAVHIDNPNCSSIQIDTTWIANLPKSEQHAAKLDYQLQSSYSQGCSAVVTTSLYAGQSDASLLLDSLDRFDRKLYRLEKSGTQAGFNQAVNNQVVRSSADECTSSSSDRLLSNLIAIDCFASSNH